MKQVIGFFDTIFFLLYLSLAILVGYMKFKQSSQFFECSQNSPVKIFFLEIYLYLFIGLMGLILLDILARIFKYISKSKDDQSEFFENTYFQHEDENA